MSSLHILFIPTVPVCNVVVTSYCGNRLIFSFRTISNKQNGDLQGVLAKRLRLI